MKGTKKSMKRNKRNEEIKKREGGHLKAGRKP